VTVAPSVLGIVEQKDRNVDSGCDDRGPQGQTS
jgi:hypothetical protein